MYRHSKTMQTLTHLRKGIPKPAAMGEFVFFMGFGTVALLFWGMGWFFLTITIYLLIHASPKFLIPYHKLLTGKESEAIVKELGLENSKWVTSKILASWTIIYIVTTIFLFLFWNLSAIEQYKWIIETTTAR